MWEKFDGIRDSGGFGNGVIAGKLLIVFHGGAYVVAKGTPVAQVSRCPALS